MQIAPYLLSQLSSSILAAFLVYKLGQTIVSQKIIFGQFYWGVALQSMVQFWKKVVFYIYVRVPSIRWSSFLTATAGLLLWYGNILQTKMVLKEI